MAAIPFATSSLLLRQRTCPPEANLPSSPVLCTSRPIFSENHGSPLVHRPLLRRPRRRLSPISAIEFEELIEKDWSFLNPSSSEKLADRLSKIDRIIAAGDVVAESRVLACFPTADFIDFLVESRPCELLIATHDSLFLLAEIKERHDSVRCWQGGVDAVPERFFPLNAAFICYFPAMGVSIHELLKSLARCCSPGARVVISCEQGREDVKLHLKEHPDTVTSDLPDRSSLEQASEKNSFQVVEFVDESSLYLAVLELSASMTSS